MEKRLYLNSGAKEVTLKSGDTGFYVDICLEDLLEMIEEHPEVKRPWVSKHKNKVFNNVRIFVLPKVTGSTHRHTFYLEAAKPLL